MSDITVYGIPNCDTIKKTLDWFKQNNHQVLFHDYRKEGISKEKLAAWLKLAPLEILLNRKSTTWRELTPDQQNKITSKAAAISLMKENCTVIKRPVIEYKGKLLVGFNEKLLEATFGDAGKMQ